MQKRNVTKSDGRYIIYYAFERPLPRLYEDQVAGAGAGESTRTSSRESTGADPRESAGTGGQGGNR